MARLQKDLHITDKKSNDGHDEQTIISSTAEEGMCKICFVKNAELRLTTMLYFAANAEQK